MSAVRLRRFLPVVAVFFALVAAAGAAFAGAAAAHRGSDAGRIAFTRYRLQNSPIWSEIWVARPDGSHAVKVSHSAKAVEDDQAHFSPDGRWIVFDRCATNAPCSVWIVRPDGSGQHRIAPCGAQGACNDSAPSFAPDGTHIVFARDWGKVKQGSIQDDDQVDHSAIIESDLAGGHSRVLLHADGYTGGFASPRISPDGKKLLFDRYGWNPARHTPDVPSVANIDGSGEHRVTPRSMQAQSGSWSPDSSTILFKPSMPTVGELTPGSNIYTVAKDGTHLRRRTNVGAYHYVIAGSFSPDGRSIVFATDANATPNPRGGTFADIFTLRLDGGNPQPVTHSVNLDGWPSWGNAG
jgi:Tol biopolymer transport system component